MYSKVAVASERDIVRLTHVDPKELGFKPVSLSFNEYGAKVQNAYLLSLDESSSAKLKGLPRMKIFHQVTVDHDEVHLEACRQISQKQGSAWQTHATSSNFNLLPEGFRPKQQKTTAPTLTKLQEQAAALHPEFYTPKKRRGAEIQRQDTDEEPENDGEDEEEEELADEDLAALDQTPKEPQVAHLPAPSASLGSTEAPPSGAELQTKKRKTAKEPAVESLEDAILETGGGKTGSLEQLDEQDGAMASCARRFDIQGWSTSDQTDGVQKGRPTWTGSRPPQPHKTFPDILKSSPCSEDPCRTMFQHNPDLKGRGLA